MHLVSDPRLPKQDSDAAAFEAQVTDYKEAGASVFHAALTGRRYEDFDALEPFRQLFDQCQRMVALAEPVLKKHRMKLAIENHKGQKPEVYERIREEIRTLCQRFPENIRIRRFAVLLKELHPDDEELTRTRKVRRALVNERYAGLIEALYGPASQHALDVRIRYEDGREASFAGAIRLAEVSA